MLDVLQLGLTETRGLALYEMSAPRGLILQVEFPTRSLSEISLCFDKTTYPYYFAPNLSCLHNHQSNIEVTIMIKGRV